MKQIECTKRICIWCGGVNMHTSNCPKYPSPGATEQDRLYVLEQKVIKLERKVEQLEEKLRKTTK